MKRPRFLVESNVNPEYCHYYDFDKQEVIEHNLHIWVTCPSCNSSRWQQCNSIRNQKVSPYCGRCSRKHFFSKPLLPEEVPQEYHQSFGFDEQKFMELRDGDDLCIRVTCPRCGMQRWQTAADIRKRNGRPLCHACSVPRGPKHHFWTGGSYVNPRGYVLLNLNLLSQEDRDLAKAMTTTLTILEHRLVMARHLNRPLKSPEHVHHRNSNRQDNRLANLKLVTRATHCTAPADEISCLMTEIESHARNIQEAGTDAISALRKFVGDLNALL